MKKDDTIRYVAKCSTCGRTCFIKGVKHTVTVTCDCVDFPVGEWKAVPESTLVVWDEEKILNWFTQYCKQCKSLNVIRAEWNNGYTPLGGCRCGAVRASAMGAWKKVPAGIFLAIWDEVRL